MFGMWLLYKVDGLCLVCGYYTRWKGCVWYVVIPQRVRVVFGMCRFTIVGSTVDLGAGNVFLFRVLNN